MARAKGVYRNGHVELDTNLPIAEGTQVEVEYPVSEEAYQEAMADVLKLMEQGFPLGERLYRSRDDLYDR